jgi:hypothetical protein
VVVVRSCVSLCLMSVVDVALVEKRNTCVVTIQPRNV